MNSVISQELLDFEVIVVDDGSTDSGPAIVAAFRDARIRIVHQKNVGVSAARNRGIDEARSDLIAFLDADDEWQPEYLATIVKLTGKYPACDVFATSYLYSGDSGETWAPKLGGLPKGFEDGVLDDYFAIAARSDPPLWSSAVAVRKRAIKAVGGFPNGLALGEDLLTWARLAARYRIAYSSKPCALFRVRRFERAGNAQRLPVEPDLVGQELARICKATPKENRRAIEKYLGIWHTMRASIFLQNGVNRAALRELGLSRERQGWSAKTLLMFALALAPSALSTRLMRFQYNLRKTPRSSAS